jgi:hypothetical protein
VGNEMGTTGDGQVFTTNAAVASAPTAQMGHVLSSAVSTGQATQNSQTNAAESSFGVAQSTAGQYVQSLVNSGAISKDEGAQISKDLNASSGKTASTAHGLGLSKGDTEKLQHTAKLMAGANVSPAVMKAGLEAEASRMGVKDWGEKQTTALDSLTKDAITEAHGFKTLEGITGTTAAQSAQHNQLTQALAQTKQHMAKATEAAAQVVTAQNLQSASDTAGVGQSIGAPQIAQLMAMHSKSSGIPQSLAISNMLGAMQHADPAAFSKAEKIVASHGTNVNSLAGAAATAAYTLKASGGSMGVYNAMLNGAGINTGNPLTDTAAQMNDNKAALANDNKKLTRETAPLTGAATAPTPAFSGTGLTPPPSGSPINVAPHSAATTADNAEKRLDPAATVAKDTPALEKRYKAQAAKVAAAVASNKEAIDSSVVTMPNHQSKDGSLNFAYNQNVQDWAMGTAGLSAAITAAKAVAAAGAEETAATWEGGHPAGADAKPPSPPGSGDSTVARTPIKTTPADDFLDDLAQDVGKPFMPILEGEAEVATTVGKIAGE